jgi:hypothetical protein
MTHVTVEQSRSKDKILILLQGYPQGQGVTINKVMIDNGLANPDSVLDAVNILEREGKIRVVRSQGHENHRDGITVFLEKSAEPQIGFSDSASEVPESLREIMRKNSANLDELTKKARH